MVAPSRVRPLTFFGKVPKGTTNVELVKALVERFSENDLKSVQDFGAGNFEVTFRSKGAVDRFLADSATLKVKENDIRFEYRGLRTVSVRIFEYPADASDQVLARELKVYGNVLSITVDNVPGFKSVSTGNRRARMEMREGVPNILDVDGHTIRCEYDGVVRLCRKCRLAGHEKAKCVTPRCERCELLYSEAISRSSAPQVQPPSTDSAGVEDAQTTQSSDKEGSEQRENQSAPGAAEVQESEGRESEPAEASPVVSQKPAPSAEAVLPASSAVEMRQEKEGGESESAEALPPTSEEATPRDATPRAGGAVTLPSAPVVKGRGRASRRRKRGGSRARDARERSSSLSGSESSEGDSPEYKRHAITVVSDDSSSTIISDSGTEQRTDGPCPVCGGFGCDCSELSDKSYSSTPDSPATGEPVAGSCVYVGRQVAKLPRDKGGLGIPDLGLMANALHVRWTHVALDSDMTLTRSFASFFLSTRLRQFSAGALSHCVPRAGTPSAFYAGAARTLAEIQRVDPEYDVVEVQLQELVDLITPPLPEHYKKFDLSRHKPSWKLITASFLDARRASFMYRLARGCLPITYRPFTKNIQRGVCPFCQSREDLAHIFCECALPKALLRKVADLFKLPGIPFPTVRYLNPLPSHAVNQFVLLLVECLYQVWLARCEAVHGGRVLGLHEVLAKVRKEVWFHLFRERYRLGAKKFLEDWHRPAVIYSESRGQLTIQL
ncbi:hypothetical protein HPB52_002780 [Rhipicephalus sanguineus]|uniref:Tick transposon n=1 Tax=Rhipicephalus sanguineus TaxID=34632 RepID=A0A9D4QGY3_RHISA|nr:hypothetical protein HPB52_002780 [Rhipicephalus sanguineus]